MAVTATAAATSFIIRPPPRSSSLRRPSNNNNNNSNATSTPRAGWLSKLSQSYSIGNKQRWQTRFFVLLDTELRCYKNEHTQTPSYVIDLGATCQPVTMTSPTNSRPYCFRLEPTTRQGNQNRPFTIACESAQELSEWMAALRSIIYKLRYQQEHQDHEKKPITCPVGPQQQKQKQRNNDDGEGSLSRRRGVLIPPLMVHPLDEIPTTVIVQSPVLSDTMTTSEEEEEEEEEEIVEQLVEARVAYVAGQRCTTKCNSNDTVKVDNVTAAEHNATATATASTIAAHGRKLSSGYSPTFLLYQERFHLLNNN